ncbi:hypothetical protein [Streptomyces sp. NPDC053367]|uniref:hypothetical protein n=1 Tax=Streptomyces sp. NPDC053367 TaxID=3365700 RepID=UPI0037D36DD7
MGTATEPRLVPYITLRDTEEMVPGTLVMDLAVPGRPRLSYRDERAGDRDSQGVLWARYSETLKDVHGMPAGEPRQRLVHPARQRESMLGLKCAVCVAPARTPLGWIFLASPNELRSEDDLVLTVQPPVCGEHVRAAAASFPHLEGRPLVYLSQCAPLHGVYGAVYGADAEHGLHVVDAAHRLLPYGHTQSAVFLAFQLVRRLTTFQLITVDELMEALTAAAVYAA